MSGAQKSCITAVGWLPPTDQLSVPPYARGCRSARARLWHGRPFPAFRMKPRRSPNEGQLVTWRHLARRRLFVCTMAKIIFGGSDTWAIRNLLHTWYCTKLRRVSRSKISSAFSETSPYPVSIFAFVSFVFNWFGFGLVSVFLGFRWSIFSRTFELTPACTLAGCRLLVILGTQLG